jgi:hypothetical protein
MDGWLDHSGRFFNPSPRISAVPIAPGEFCIVIDEALANPEGLIDWATSQRFAAPDFAYPGLLVDAPPSVSTMVGDYFAQYLRSRLGGRRTLSTRVRLSLVTLSPQELRPPQWQCHRDRLGPLPGGLRIAAMITYLFRDAALGGTSFYRSLQNDQETERMIDDAGGLEAREFSARYGLEAGYLNGSNRYFERVAQIPAAWNRMLFYNSDVFHSGDIPHPERLSAEPRRGRLTLNGFFTCRRAAR